MLPATVRFIETARSLDPRLGVCQPVPAPGKWPEKQRYDYLVRERVLSATEVKQFQDSLQATGGRRSKAGFAQRDAVLFALRELTGKDYEKARTPESRGRR